MRSPQIGVASYNAEAAWGEVSSVFGTRLATLGAIDTTALKWDRRNPDRTKQFKDETSGGYPGIKGGTFKTKFLITGHGSSTASGALTLSAFENLLGIVLGNVTAAIAAGGTTATAGGTASALNVAAVNGYLAGSLLRVGQLSDGRGNGQMGAVSSHSVSVINMLTAIDAALSNGDVVYNPANIYETQNPVAANAITGTRWLLQTGNLCWECHGCYPKSWVIAGQDPGGDPTIEITWGVSWWIPVNTPPPNATSVQDFAAAPTASGSLFLQTYGTATRQKYDVRKLAITYTLNVMEQKGPGGNDPNQIVVGCLRGRSTCAIDVTIDAPAATATPDFLSKWTSGSPFHMLFTGSAKDGTAYGFYWPLVYPDGDAPTQLASDNINSVKLRFKASADGSKATELERSMMRMALA